MRISDWSSDVCSSDLDVKLRDIVYDQGDFITTSIDNVERVLIEASVVVTIVLFVFLMNARTTIISLTAIPISACAAILVLDAMGQSIKDRKSSRLNSSH